MKYTKRYKYHRFSRNRFSHTHKKHKQVGGIIMTKVYYVGTYNGNIENDKREGKGIMDYNDGRKYDGYWKNDIYEGHGKLTYTDNSEKIYIGNFKNGKRHGLGDIKDKDGSEYSGHWEDDLPNGEGRKKYSNGSEYTGQWKNNKRHGLGDIKDKDGSEYSGHWADNIPNGEGRKKYADGSEYTGQWQNDKRFGMGTMTFMNENVYTGHWEYDMQKGEGEMIYADGSIYSGEWKNNYKWKKGVMRFTNGNIYDGNWDDDYMVGQGKMFFKNGDEFTGLWTKQKTSNQLLIGQMFNGIMKYHNGDIYDGSWSDSEKNGIGTMTYADGTIYSGEWKYDEPLLKDIIVVYLDGSVYNGNLKTEKDTDIDIKSGRGKMTYPATSDKREYNGSWLNDTINGIGHMIYTNGDEYKGHWVNGQRSGHGRMRYNDGKIYNGLWKNDLRDGNGSLFGSDGRVIFNGLWIADTEMRVRIEEGDEEGDDESKESGGGGGGGGGSTSTSTSKPKKKATITIMINAHGQDLLEQIPDYGPLYPNSRFKAQVRVLSQAGTTCSVALTFLDKGNRSINIGKNISKLFHYFKEYNTFEILNMYRLHLNREKYSKSIIQLGNSISLSAYDITKKLHKNTSKRTYKTSEKSENFALFNPIFDHKYVFNDDNGALQQSAGIYVLDIRNADSNPLYTEMMDKRILTLEQQKILYYLIIDWLETVNPLPEIYANRKSKFNSAIIGRWIEILTTNRITGVVDLVEYCAENDLYIDGPNSHKSSNSSKSPRGSKSPKSPKSGKSGSLVELSEDPIDVYNISKIINDTLHYRNSIKFLETFQTLRIDFETTIFNCLNIATPNYFKPFIQDVVGRWFIHRLKGVKLANKIKFLKKVKQMNIKTFAEFYDKIKSKELRFDITPSDFDNKELDEYIDNVPNKQSDKYIEDEQLSTEWRAFSLIDYNQKIAKINLTDIVDELYEKGFEIINIVDLSCRHYAFDNWTTTNANGIEVKYVPSEEEENRFINIVEQLENDYKTQIDSRYG